MRWLGAIVLSLPCLVGCSVGEGQGQVRSEQLIVDGCFEGAFNLRPDFFAVNPYRETMTIRIQRGQQYEEVSDGVLVTIADAEQIRGELLGQRVPLGLPASVTPPGQPVVPQDEPPLVSLAIYLHQTCHKQNAVLYSIGGWIQFDSLFSGNVNEDNADKRLTEAHFEATVTDPRTGELVRGSNGELSIDYPPEEVSILEGSFEFFFHRGTPAQPFP